MGNRGCGIESIITRYEIDMVCSMHGMRETYAKLEPGDVKQGIPMRMFDGK